MRQTTRALLCGVLSATLLTSCSTSRIWESTAKEAFGGLRGALVVIECSSGHTMTYCPDVAATPVPPCSTFKIVNALIGRRPTWAKLLYIDGGLELVWAHGSPKVVDSR